MRDKTKVTPDNPWVTSSDKAYFYSTEDGEPGTVWDGESYYCKGWGCKMPVKVGQECWNCRVVYHTETGLWVLWYVVAFFFFFLAWTI